MKRLNFRRTTPTLWSPQNGCNEAVRNASITRFKPLLAIVFICLASFVGRSVEIDFLNYSVDTDAKTATVTGLASAFTSATVTNLVIPDFISYNGEQIPVTSIKYQAFYRKSNLKGLLIIGNNVQTIGDYAFQNCTSFTGSLVIGENVQTIGQYAFYGCSGFTGSLTIPQSVTFIGYSAFSYCSGFTGSLAIGNNVQTIGESAFNRCSGFTGSLTIPNSVQTIGAIAFDGCSGFTGSLTIGNNVQTIGNSAFYGCSGFTGSLTIPDNVQTIGSSAFYGCSGFTGSLTIGNSVQTIDSRAFFDCSGFTGSLTIPQSVTFIGYSAFSYCSGFTGTLTIGNSVQTIGDHAFSGCSGFTGSLTIPNSVQTIGNSAFSGCSGFTGELIIPNSVQTIGNYAFSDCSGFTGSLIIGNNVTTIGYQAFDGCRGFTGSLTIGNNVQTIGERAFQSCSGFTGSLSIPNSVITIGICAFEDCSGFTGSLTIGNSVEAIGIQAFNRCSGFTGSLTIGNNVKTIERGAFGYCKFSEVKSSAKTPATAGGDAFYNFYTSPLYVPAESVSLYKAADEWKRFQYINPLVVEATDIRLNKTELELLIGESETLTATLTPQDASEEIVWSVDEAGKSIISIDQSGKVTGLTVGTATVTATAGKVSATCKVTVKPILATSITITVPDKEVFVGDKITLTATVTPENTTDKTLVWASETPAIATINASSGELTALAPGEAKIKVSCGNISSTATVTVKPIVAQSVKLSAEDITLLVGGSQKLTATVTPENTTDKTVTWTSEKEAIATVGADGTVTGIAVGVTTVTARCGSVSATCKVTVNPVLATTVTISVPDKEVFVGDKITLTATVTPENTTDKTIEWKSGATNIATINAATGELTALAPGQVTVTATCGTISGTATITVKAVVANSIQLSANDITMLVGQTERLTATVLPENTTDKTVTWKSDNEAIATVGADGTVTGIAVGEANITATCGSVSATCKVTVNPVPTSGVILNTQNMTLLVGQSDQLTATVLPEDTTDKTVTWKSDNEAIATVGADGTVTGIAVGVATVTATCGEASATCKVTVNPVLASTVTISVPDKDVFVGDKITLTATVTPENTTDKTIEWKSGDTNIATINSETGELTALAPGQVTVTATCGAISGTATITVKAVVANSIQLSANDLTLLVGQTDRLTATVLPENTTDKTVTWKSDNEAIATVGADGTVTGIAVGVATVTATCGEATATCKVTVEPVTGTTIVLNVQDLTIYVGETDRLTATVLPEDTTDKTVTWKSDKESIATVGADGTVTGIAVGVATVTATCGEASATCKVTVKPISASGITLNAEDLTLYVGETDRLTATVLPESVTDKTVTWKSDNEAIATVGADGTVTGIAVGVATVTATCGEATATCKVTVKPISASGITLNAEDLTLYVGETDRLTATVLPESVTDKTVTWKSDNEAIATVGADGTVTGIAVGVATVTATCGEATATCKVTVKPISASGITLNAEDLTLYVGETDRLTATVLPENTTDKTVTWKSDNEAIATVGADGTVSGVSVGVATVTATCGEASATCKVTVITKALNPVQLLRKGDGTSNTFVVMMDQDDETLEKAGYRYVFGYDSPAEGSQVIEDTPWRYTHTDSDIYWNDDNDFWVFAYYVEQDGTVCVSSRVHLDGTTDSNFNPQEFIGRASRGGEHIVGIYTLEGFCVGKDIEKLSPGIYIVKTTDSSYKIVK